MRVTTVTLFLINLFSLGAQYALFGEPADIVTVFSYQRARTACSLGLHKMTTSWSIPNGPPDGPQVHQLAVCFSARTPELNSWAGMSTPGATPMPPEKNHPQRSDQQP